MTITFGVVAPGKGERSVWERWLGSMHVDGWEVWVHADEWLGLGCLCLGDRGALHMGCTMGMRLSLGSGSELWVSLG